MTPYAKVKDGIVVAVALSYPDGSENKLSEKGWVPCSDMTKPGWTYDKEQASFNPPRDNRVPYDLFTHLDFQWAVNAID